MPASNQPSLATRLATASCSRHVEVAGSKGHTYLVTCGTDGKWACTCQSFKFSRGTDCKHIMRVREEEGMR